MKQVYFICKVLSIFVAAVIAIVPTLSARAAVAPELVIREIKITGEELVVLQATTAIADLSTYWVGYNGSETVSPGVIVPSQQLPVRSLAAGQAVLLTSDAATTCDAVLSAKLSVSLSDTKGTLVVRQLASSGLSSTFTTVDSVNWAKPSASGSTAAALDLRRESSAGAAPLWYHDPAAYDQPWRPGSMDGCTLTLAAGTAGSSSEPSSTVSWVPATVEPPAVIEQAATSVKSSVSTDGMPARNPGLAAPLVTELMPNPTGTGNDASDEFIELYNSNDASFDLSGWVLQTGTTTLHSYTFPAGTVMSAKSFRVWYASETKLSMSNSGGQVNLLDGPDGTTASQSAVYDTASDGQAWALANGKWYWTTKLTAGAANVIAQPIAKSATGIKKLTSTTTTTKKAGTTKTSAKSSAKSNNAQDAQPVAAVQPRGIHPAVLVTVAVVAIGYGVYEYRHDLANAFYRIRPNRVFGRTHR